MTSSQNARNVRANRPTPPLASLYTPRSTNPTNPPRIRPTWTPMRWRARCLELLATHRAGWWAAKSSRFGLAEDGELLWLETRVASATVADLVYTGRYDARDDSARCSCAAGSAHQPCWHAGATLAAGRRAVELQHLSAVALANDRWYRERWEQNDTAILPSL